jgi:hypothetical protein
MCSSTQPKMFPGSMPLGSGGTFSMPTTYQGGTQPTFDAGNPNNFPRVTPPPAPVRPVNPILGVPGIPRISPYLGGGGSVLRSRLGGPRLFME